MPRDESRDVSALRALWRPLVSETLATALLVMLGVGSLLRHDGAPPTPLTHPALAFAFLVTALIAVFGPVSGAHMNPAITLARVLHGRMAPLPATAYVLAQLVGGIVGFALLVAVAPAARLEGVGCSGPEAAGSAATAAVVEAVMTGVVALVCCAAWAEHDDERPDRTAPIKIGLAVGGVVYGGGPLSSASLNPARSFGPALWHMHWDHHWVYWVGPLGGAALAALLHRFVLTSAARAPPPAPLADALPLHDKPER